MEVVCRCRKAGSFRSLEILRREYPGYHNAYSELAQYYNTLASRTNLFGEIELPSSKGLSSLYTTQLDFIFRCISREGVEDGTQ